MSKFFFHSDLIRRYNLFISLFIFTVVLGFRYRYFLHFIKSCHLSIYEIQSVDDIILFGILVT